MSTKKIDPDAIRKNDPAYWAAALVLAIQSKNQASAEAARQNLERLGYRLTTADKIAKEVKNEPK